MSNNRGRGSIGGGNLPYRSGGNRGRSTPSYPGGGNGGFNTVAGQPTEFYANALSQDPEVEKMENALHPSHKKKLSSTSTSTHVTRPGYGTKGSKVVLTANYVELSLPAGLMLHRYNYTFAPQVTGKKLVRLMQLLLESSELAPFRNNMATDFRTFLIAKTKLEDVEYNLQITYRNEGEDEPATGATTHKANIKYAKTLSIVDLMSYLASSDINHPLNDKEERIQALNMFLNHYVKGTGNLATIGACKSFFINENSPQASLGSGLVAVRGYFSSVRLATTRVLVNINVSNGAFYRAGHLLDIMEEFSGNRTSHNTAALEQFLKRVRVKTTHLPEKFNKAGDTIPRTKTIFGLARKDDGYGSKDPLPKVPRHGADATEVMFWYDSKASSTSTTPALNKEQRVGIQGKNKDKGKTKATAAGASASSRYVTVAEFFKLAYNIVLKYPRSPVINCGNRAFPVYLPSEVCYIIPGQASITKLSPAQTDQMIKFAVRKPWLNARSIVDDGIDAVGLNEQTNKLLPSFNIKAAKGLIKVSGRILASPLIFYKGSLSVKPHHGSWNMKDITFSKGISLMSWGTLMINLPNTQRPFDKTNPKSIMDELSKTLRKVGIDNPTPGATSLKSIELTGVNDPKLEEWLNMASKNFKILFILLPERNIPLYKRIKTIADRQYGIHTICSIGSKLAKSQGREQYMANIALKFNLKLGGQNQRLLEANLGIIKDNKTMVVGIDVTHPSPGSTANAPSVSAMVASVDTTLSQWPATLRVQTGKQETVDELTDMLKTRLELWKTKGNHQNYPENILVYRDGVSEGQYNIVTRIELEALRKACRDVYPPSRTPRFTVVVCGKRHKTRFYPTNQDGMDKSGNTKAGTVVDRGVTDARDWDFFLQAHAALQGTARPCHYFVVHDEIFRHLYATGAPAPHFNVADVVEDLTHNMCYLFGRATKAVSLCPPAYYADLACERARCYLASHYDAPSASAAPSVANGPAAGLPVDAQNADVLVHAKLRDTMFYI